MKNNFESHYMRGGENQNRRENFERKFKRGGENENKGDKFGRYYHCWIWFFYTMFFLCFALASTLVIPDLYRMMLFMISIVLGFIHLINEFRQFLWNPIIYINDIWNLFGKKLHNNFALFTNN